MIKGSKHSEESKKRISEGHKGQVSWNKGKHLSEKHKKRLKESHRGMLGRKHSEETKRKISLNGVYGGMQGKKHSEETKVKMRESTFGYAKRVRNALLPRFGKNETFILDKLQEKLNYKIQRQFKVEGYFLDGYIPEIKLAVEIDERPKILEKDIEREKIITKKLGCNFFRIKDYG